MQVLADEQSTRDEVEVLACDDRPVTRVRQVNARLRVTRVASLGRVWSLPIAPTFPLYLRQRSGVLHFHHPFPCAEVAFVMQRQRNPTVVTWHSDIVRQRAARRLYHSMLLRFLRRVHLIIATSPNYLRSSPYLRRVALRRRIVP